MTERLYFVFFLLAIGGSSLASCADDDASVGAGDACDPQQELVAGCESLTCNEREQAVEDWLVSLAVCEEGEDCKLVEPVGCFLSSLCNAPVAASINEEDFADVAKQLRDQQLRAQREGDCTCPIADCRLATGAACDAGTCVAVYE